MSLVLTGLAVAGALLCAGATTLVLVRRNRARALPPAPTQVLPPGPAATGLRSQGFAADVGDVVSLARSELWLEEAWVLSEREPLAAVYFAREAVVVLFPEGERCLRLHPVELPSTTESPTTLEHDGERFGRVRRRPVLVTAQGREAVPFSEAVLAEYEGLGNTVLWLLTSRGGQRAWVGQSLSTIEFERWGPGGSR